MKIGQKTAIIGIFKGRFSRTFIFVQGRLKARPCQFVILFAQGNSTQTRGTVMDRKLVAILAADVVGYSTLMEQDEQGTFERLRAAGRIWL